ncbi:hypothetical protein [Actinomyces sp.]|uniref:hypothetical protein n=1 Tax=Actinomyces sp. TaxID=29317 RepID=UPI0026DC0110|nr:hypothetical protein [Actinomyces sp.]MDO4901729.1 hypothetical protein [Actinomyces sp.]
MRPRDRRLLAETIGRDPVTGAPLGVGCGQTGYGTPGEPAAPAPAQSSAYGQSPAYGGPQQYGRPHGPASGS